MRKDFKSIQSAYVVFEHLYQSQFFIQSHSFRYGIMRGTTTKRETRTKQKLVKISISFCECDKWLSRGVEMKSNGHIHVNVGKGVRHGQSTEKISKKLF